MARTKKQEQPATPETQTEQPEKKVAEKKTAKKEVKSKTPKVKVAKEGGAKRIPKAKMKISLKKKSAKKKTRKTKKPVIKAVKFNRTVKKIRTLAKRLMAKAAKVTPKASIYKKIDVEVSKNMIPVVEEAIKKFLGSEEPKE